MDEIRDVLAGLANALSVASNSLHGSSFYVVIAAETGKPEVRSFPDMQQCSDCLKQLSQSIDDTSPCYVFVFEGKRWRVHRRPLRLVSPDGTVHVLERSESGDDENEDRV